MAEVVFALSILVALLGLALLSIKIYQRDLESLGGAIGPSLLLSALFFGLPAYLGIVAPETSFFTLAGIALLTLGVVTTGLVTLYFIFVEPKANPLVFFLLITAIEGFVLISALDTVI